MLQLELGTKEKVAQVTCSFCQPPHHCCALPVQCVPSSSARHGILAQTSPTVENVMGAPNNALMHCSSLLLPLFWVYCHTPGIILKRQAKPTGGDASRRKPSDLASLADSVQKLCQVALPLARSLEFLQEDVDSMSKEHRCACLWVCARWHVGTQCAICVWMVLPPG